MRSEEKDGSDNPLVTIDDFTDIDEDYTIKKDNEPRNRKERRSKEKHKNLSYWNGKYQRTRNNDTNYF